MGYRNQSGISQFRETNQTSSDNIGGQIISSVVDVFGTELINIGKANKLRKEINNDLLLKSQKNQELLINEISGFGMASTNIAGVNDKSRNLEEVYTPIVDELSTAQLNLELYRGRKYTRKHINKDTGEESTRTREDDEAIVSRNKDLIKNAQAYIGSEDYNIGMIEEQLARGMIGENPGQTPIDSIDPYAFAVALASNPINGQGVNKRYFLEEGENGEKLLMLEYQGESIGAANKKLKIEGDKHVVNLKKRSEIQLSTSSQPNNSASSNTSNYFAPMYNKTLGEIGVFDEDNQFSDEFRIPDEKGPPEVSNGTKTIYQTKSINYTGAIESTNVQAKSLADLSSDAGPNQMVLDLKAHSIQTTDANNNKIFSIIPGAKTNDKGMIMYDTDGKAIMKDAIKIFDEDGAFIASNFDGRELKQVLQDVIQQNIMTNGGAYDPQEKIAVSSSKIPAPPKTPPAPEPTGEDTDLFQILSTPVDDDPETLMLGGEDKVLEIKNILLDDENFTGIGRDAEGPYVVYKNKKNREPKKYNFYRNSILESVDQNEKPHILKKIDELEKMTPSKSISIKKAVDMIVDEANKKEYQNIGIFVDDDNEKKFAEYLIGLGFDPNTIDETDLKDYDFDNKEEMTTYIKDKIFESDTNKDVARKMSGSGAGVKKIETPEERVNRILNQQNAAK